MTGLDELLLGDPARRAAFGLALLALSGAALTWVEWEVRRRDRSYLDHHAVLAFGATCAPIGIAVLLSAPFGLVGAGVFLAVAIAACGVGAFVMLVRGAA
jgi:hypothetical protein